MADKIPQWAMILARALSIHFGAETTGAQRDETHKNIARALVAVNTSPERERQVNELVEAALAMLGLFGKPRPEEYVDGGASYRLAVETVKTFTAALAPFADPGGSGRHQQDW